MRQYLGEQRHWLEMERLPAYTPELNPVEGLWGNLKGRDLPVSSNAHVIRNLVCRPGCYALNR